MKSIKTTFLILSFFILHSSFYTLKAQYTNLLEFNYTNGALPQGSLFSYYTTLYGMTPYGGALKHGCVFSINLAKNNQYSDMLDFDSTHGARPYGSLCLAN